MAATETTTSNRFQVWSSPFVGPWFVLRYWPTSLWSLKSSQATSSGGKTLLVPTPYSLKVGLVDAVIQAQGVSAGERLFDLLKGRPLRVCPPESAVITATFLKTWKLERPDSEDEIDDESARAKTFSPSVGFREYVHFGGEGEGALFHIAIAGSGFKERERTLLVAAARAFTYSGKRGGFLRHVPSETGDGLVELGEVPWSAPYTLPNSVWAKSGAAVPIGMIQPLDELSAGAKWNNVNTYGSGKVTVVLEEKPTFARKKRTEADRVIVQTLVPYRLKRSSRGYSHYERLR